MIIVASIVSVLLKSQARTKTKKKKSYTITKECRLVMYVLSTASGMHLLYRGKKSGAPPTQQGRSRLVGIKLEPLFLRNDQLIEISNKPGNQPRQQDFVFCTCTGYRQKK